MPAVTRTLEITYGGVLVGGSSDYLVPGKITFTKDYERASIAFQVIVQNDTAATFQTACATLEAAYRNPRQALVVSMEGQTVLSFDPSANTGFHSAPTIAKVGDPLADTGRSRLYACSVTFDLPADLAGVSGRQFSSSSLDYDPARRRRIVITGRYTALGGNGAKAQYESAGPTYCASVVSSLGSGGTFDLIDELLTPDDQDKWCDFSRTYQEVFYGTASATLSHASIRASSVVFQRSRQGPGDSPGKNTKRLEVIGARVECFLDQDVSTDLEGLWNDTIRPYMIQQIRSRFDVSTIADVNEDASFDPTANKITGQVVCSCVVSGATTLEYRRSVKVTNDLGELLQPAFGGKRFDKYRFEGIANRFRETTELETRLGLWSVAADGGSFSSSGGSAGSGGGSVRVAGAGIRGSGASIGGGSIGNGRSNRTSVASGDAGSGSGGGGAGASAGSSTGSDGYVLIATERSATPLTLGIEETFDATLLVTVTTEQYYEEPSGSGGGGGGPITTPGAPNPQAPIGAITPGIR